MMVSTKGRYALRVMLDLAERLDEGFISLKSISERQEISMKYLELIVAMLNKGDVIISQRGKGGGYMLAREPAQITVAEVVRLVEGSMSPVSCLNASKNLCERATYCMTLPMWQQLGNIIDNYLCSVTLQDLLDGTVTPS